MSRIWTHHVFPSFRGEDVRREFFSHIHKEFQRMGITLFIDNEIQRGESIGPELIRAIRESRVAVLLLSRNYASSTWCLDELVEILKCREELGQIVMVIFYKVDPSDVKKLSGDFGKVFKRTCAKKGKEDIRRWKQALTKVATIAGYDSSHWDNEAAMIKHIATTISNKLNNSISSSDFDGLVGMKHHLEKMEPLLCLDTHEVRMIGIWGPPGIGKTTIARVAYNQLSNRFQLSVFMENIKANYTKPCSDDYSAKLQLQQQFMSQITNHKDMEIPHLGIAHDRLKDKKVLAILDGVDHFVQLDAMAKETRWFGPGSRIIITTQDQKLLRAHGINNIYKVDFPSSYEALQIFCMYAFGQKVPKDGFEELAQIVTELTGELPLGLRVMGSYFRGMSKREWIKSLPGLETSLDADIQSILMFSYNALDDRNKELFLHIACFFNGEKIEKVEEHLAKKLVDVRHRLNILAEKSLISIESGYVIIKMDSLLVKLGEEIVRKQSIDEPGQRQFLVDRGDICEVLAYATGSKSVIGIDYYDSSGFWEKLDISDASFEGMPNLQFLRVNDIARTLQFPRGLNDLSRKLRLLHWSYFPMTCLPSIVSFEFLVELNMHHSRLEKLWEGIKPLQNLKRMDLSDSVHLKELPDFSTATNLLELVLSNCHSLLEVPSSIRNATNLEKIYLIGCSSLVKFPILGNTVNLRELNLRDCSSLVRFPSIGNATNLKKLFLGGCSSLVEFPFIENAINLNYVNFKSVSNLLELPFSTRNATNLFDLYLRNCSGLIKLPSSIGNCINLYRLDLANCSSLITLPSSIGNATELENLDLSNCSNLVELPISIGNLQKLKMLRLVGCSKLEVLPTNINFKFLDELDLTNCSMLKSFLEISTNVRVLVVRGTTIEDESPLIRSWPPVYEARMSYFENLEEITHELDNIKKLYLGDERRRDVPPWIRFFLDRLVLKGCRKLVSLPQIADSISWIDAEACESLERLDCFFQNPMYFLNFGKCSKLNQEARDLIIQTPISRHAVLPGEEVPKYFTHRATNGGPLTIKLHERPIPTLIRFKACILLVYKGNDDEKNFPTGLFVTCGRSRQFLCPAFTGHLYTFEVEAEVTSSELVFEFRVKHYDDWKIGECGVRQLLELEQWP